MELLAQIAEATLIVSAVTHGLLFVFAMIYRDGAVWATWRLSILFGGLSAVGGVGALHFMQAMGPHAHQGAVLALVIVSIARMGSSVTNILFTFHLHRELFSGRGRGDVNSK